MYLETCTLRPSEGCCNKWAIACSVVLLEELEEEMAAMILRLLALEEDASGERTTTWMAAGPSDGGSDIKT